MWVARVVTEDPHHHYRTVATMRAARSAPLFPIFGMAGLALATLVGVLNGATTSTHIGDSGLVAEIADGVRATRFLPLLPFLAGLAVGHWALTQLRPLVSDARVGHTWRPIRRLALVGTLACALVAATVTVLGTGAILGFV